MPTMDIDVGLERADGFRLAVRQSFDPSGITAVFGANGSGKTSLLRAIAGLESSTQGNIRFRGETWLRPGFCLAPNERSVGFVFQDGRLFSHLTVRGNLEFPRKHGKRSGPIDIRSVATAFGLEHLMHRSPAELSGGERQRVAIARALLANPDLLLMDEPLSSLDQARRRELLPLIQSLPEKHGIPIIYVTHDIDELVYLADRVLLLASGRNIAMGSAREIIAHQDFESLTESVQPGMVLEAKVARHEQGLSILALDRDELRIPRVDRQAGETVQLRVRPRDVIIAKQRVAGISIRNCLAATVRAIDRTENDQVLVDLDLGDQRLKAHITADAATELELEERSEVFALIKTVVLDMP